MNTSTDPKPTDRTRRKTGEAHPVDVYVGARMKQRRIERKMSQEKLGNLLNLTFQQVQKYERGANRVGASRLFELSQALQVPVNYFFDDMPSHVGDAQAPMPTEAPGFTEGSVLSRSETLRLVTNYYNISSDAQRRTIYEMIKGLADAEGGES